jgi:glycosyltransferase involved in cell wall biosynthesis
MPNGQGRRGVRRTVSNRAMMRAQVTTAPDLPSSHADLELTVLMPCLNEARTLGSCVRKAQDFLERAGVRGEVLVSDNASTDGSQQIARNLGARVVDVPMRGYGAAIYHGTKAARGRFVIVGDADDSYDFSDLDRFVSKLREGYELVIGNRFEGGIRPGAMPWKNRYIGNPVLSALGRSMFGAPVRDFHCGLRGYTLDAFERMDLRTTGMEFASEMVIKATMLGLSIGEVPITLSRDGRERPPHLRPFRDGWRHLRFMLLYSPRWLFFYPGLALAAIGLVLMTWLLPDKRVLFGIGLDVHTLIYAAAAILIGSQAVGFAVLARVAAAKAGLLPPKIWPRGTPGLAALEMGLMIGGVIFVAGFLGSVTAVIIWGREEFGALDVRRMLRLVIPTVTAMTLGLQIMLFAFFGGVIGLDTRASAGVPRQPDADPQDAGSA